MKKHWKTILVIIAFVFLFAIQIRDVIVIKNMEDWLSDYYSYQSSLNRNNPSTGDVEELNERVSRLEVAVNNLDSAMQKVWSRLGFY